MNDFIKPYGCSCYRSSDILAFSEHVVEKPARSGGSQMCGVISRTYIRQQSHIYNGECNYNVLDLDQSLSCRDGNSRKTALKRIIPEMPPIIYRPLRLLEVKKRRNTPPSQ